MYELGHGVPQDHEEAVRWYRLSAEQGSPVGQWKLGNMYESGSGVPQDYVTAHAWFSLAAARGNWTGEQGARDQYVNNAEADRDDIARRMTARQLASAQDLAGALRTRIFGEDAAD